MYFLTRGPKLTDGEGAGRRTTAAGWGALLTEGRVYLAAANSFFSEIQACYLYVPTVADKRN